MFDCLVLSASLAVPQLNRPLPLFREDDLVESIAAIDASIRYEPVSGRVVVRERDEAGAWRQSKLDGEATRARARFELRFDPAARTLSWRLDDGGRAVELPLALSDGSGGPNLLRLEVADPDARATLRLEHLELQVAERSEGVRPVGAKRATSDGVTLWAAELEQGFRLTGELVVRSDTGAASRVAVEAGIGRGRRIEIELDGPGEVRSEPPGLIRIPGQKVALGYFSTRAPVVLEALGDDFVAWRSGSTERRDARLDLAPAAGESYWQAAYRQPVGEAVTSSGENSGRTFSGQTYMFSNGAPITVPSGAPTTTLGKASPYPLTIDVSGPAAGPIQDMNVHLYNVDHTFPDDLDALLVSPKGTTILLMSDACGPDNLVNLDLEFDDEAVGSLSNDDASACVAGSVRPTNFGTGDTFDAPAPAGPYLETLGPLDGENPNGVWNLYVMDDGSSDVGVIDGFGLEFTTGSYELKIPSTGDSGPANPYPWTIQRLESSTQFGTILDVNARIRNLYHSYPDDLDILLVAPNGDSTILMSDACGSDDIAGIEWKFDDEAPAVMSDSTITDCIPVLVRPTDYGVAEDLPAPAPAGPYAVSLSVFDGDSPFGTWKLFVRDDGGGDEGFVTLPWLVELALTGIFRGGFEQFGFCEGWVTEPPTPCDK